MLPDLNGYAVCRSLRNSPTTRSIPIIMITALDDSTHRFIALTLGVNDLVTKPFSLQGICRAREQLIRGKLQGSVNESRE